MSNTNDSHETVKPAQKMTLQEAVQKQLERKKNQNSAGNANSHQSQKTQKMKSQQTKKVSNSRRKMGV
ncbi:hypothetical protein [Bacillus sp. T33-2]|uniref:hypothetical protein n=1 Tax=Bacillus sp. T33-2 TaxID=2054168 RepID=UPI000C78C40E|nr:hypothetical protein [Bacillus sp. T33-2]PLR94857.1 hypothetical protein CVD19_16445 [Bacillus sp. T33-2]